MQNTVLSNSRKFPLPSRSHTLFPTPEETITLTFYNHFVALPFNFTVRVWVPKQQNRLVYFQTLLIKSCFLGVWLLLLNIIYIFDSFVVLDVVISCFSLFCSIPLYQYSTAVSFSIARLMDVLIDSGLGLLQPMLWGTFLCVPWYMKADTLNSRIWE